MRPSDIAAMCVQNLKRRRARTVLTALGVMVGTASIVIMVSIGFGLSEQTERTLAQMGDLTLVQIYGNQGGGADAAKLDDEAIQTFRHIDGVVAASGKFDLNNYSFSTRLKAGLSDRYQTYWANVVGLDAASLDAVGYSPMEGEQIEAAAGASAGLSGQDVPAEALAGQWLAYNFVDSYRPEGANQVDRYAFMYSDQGEYLGDDVEVPEPYVDLLSCGPVTLEITDWNDNVLASQQVVFTGVLKEDYSRGWETSEGLVMDTAVLRSLVRRALDAQASSQDFTGGSTSTDSYSNAIVKVEGIDRVAEVEEAIGAMGFNTYSMESVRKPMEEQAAQQQLLLGGLGAVSLFVAALGITNTMIMSVSERTREIGVMKALGCYVGDVKALFLAEAAAIGLIGGVVGCLVSMAASVGMNLFSRQSFTFDDVVWSFMGGEAARMSVIPWWLYAFAVVFAMLVGLGSGYLPARKAVKVSAIEAIRGV